MPVNVRILVSFINFIGRISDLNRLLDIANRRLDLLRLSPDRLKAIVYSVDQIDYFI